MVKNIFGVNFLSRLYAKTLQNLSKIFFKDVKYYLQTGIHASQPLPYPCIILVNNVEERDVLTIGFLSKIFHLKTNIFFPLKNNFPDREYICKKKSIWKKFISFLIIQLSIIPILLRLAGGNYVRKDLFNLLRTVRRSTKNTIYEKFESFKQQIKKRKIFVLFGYELGIGDDEIETTSGILRIFNSKNPNMTYVQLTLTYDYLLFKEGIVHISHSGTFQMSPEKTNSSIASTLKLKRALSTTVTPGNLFAFAIYSPEVQGGVSRQYLFYKMERLANVIYREKICNIAKECLEMSYDELFAEILYNAKNEDFLKYDKEAKQYYGTNKLYFFPKNKSLKTENIYRFHFMQIALFHKKFRQIWTEIEIYD